MSHSVTMNTTRTTTSGSRFTINTSYIRTLPGILKVSEVVLGIICVGIIGDVYSGSQFSYHWKTLDGPVISPTPMIFYFLMTTTFLIASIILLIPYLVSLSTGSIISETIYFQEMIYHSIACVLLFAASLNLFVHMRQFNSADTDNYHGRMAASVIGLISAALYFLSTLLAVRSYRSI